MLVWHKSKLAKKLTSRPSVGGHVAAASSGYRPLPQSSAAGKHVAGKAQPAKVFKCTVESNAAPRNGLAERTVVTSLSPDVRPLRWLAPSPS